MFALGMRITIDLLEQRGSPDDTHRSVGYRMQYEQKLDLPGL